MDKYAVIVAGGAGTRMKTDLPKQFLLLGETPVLMHTIAQFYNYDNSIKLIIVLPKYQINFWKSLCTQHKFLVKHQIVIGGITRFYSVQNGLALVPENSIVAIHDGVRPLVSKKIIATSFKTAQTKGSAITAITLKDSLRKIKGDKSISKPRSKYLLVQTPQTFKSALLKQAYSTIEPSPNFTDDASVFEAVHKKINIIIGDYKNLKITTPEDLIIAQALKNNF